MSEEKKKEVEMMDLEKGERGTSDKKKEKTLPPPRVSVFTLFRYASFVEKIMIFLGMLGGLGHGLIQPLFIRTFGGLIDSIHINLNTVPTQEEINNLFNTFNGFIVILYYLAAAALVVAYVRNAMFVLVGNSMANKIRKEYLKANLRQEIGWFDLESLVPKVRNKTIKTMEKTNKQKTKRKIEKKKINSNPYQLIKI